MPVVSRESRRWRVRALAIPDGPLRVDAVRSLSRKRDHAEGAALFAVLGHRRDPRLLRLLIAYQTIWDFLDNASERAPDAANARQLHLALTDALDPDAPISDYYRHHPYKRDGGYLLALVQSCRADCLALPSYRQVRARMLAGVALCEVQSAQPPVRSAASRCCTEALGREASSSRGPDACVVRACSGSERLSATRPTRARRRMSPSESDVAQTLEAYFPWISLALTMLDSYNDWCADLATGGHSYISHYDDPREAVQRVFCEIVEQAARRARALPGGHRHAVVLAAMVAMHLSRTTAWTPRCAPAPTRSPGQAAP